MGQDTTASGIAVVQFSIEHEDGLIFRGLMPHAGSAEQLHAGQSSDRVILGTNRLRANCTFNLSECDHSYDLFVGETSDYRWNEQIYGTWELGRLFRGPNQLLYFDPKYAYESFPEEHRDTSRALTSAAQPLLISGLSRCQN